MNEVIFTELEECGSTNDEAWKHASSESPVLVSTKVQTKGRGRQGRKWVNPAAQGNITASLIFPAPALNLHWIPLAAGVSMVEEIQKAVGEKAKLSGLRLKWPNDIYWNDAKMGGILCESKVSGDRVFRVVAGIGVNIAHAPELAEMKTVSLSQAAFGGDISAEEIQSLKNEILRNWASRLLYWIDMLSHDSTEPLRQAWVRLARLDQFNQITVHDRSGGLVQVKMIGLDPTGKLHGLLKDSGKSVLLDQADSI